MLQIVACTGDCCVNRNRAIIAPFLGANGFLPAPVKFEQTDSGLKLANPSQNSTGKLPFAPPLLAASILKNQKTSIPVDYYCPSMREKDILKNCKCAFENDLL